MIWISNLYCIDLKGSKYGILKSRIYFSASIHPTVDHICAVFGDKVFIFGNFNAIDIERRKYYTMELNEPFEIRDAGETIEVSY